MIKKIILWFLLIVLIAMLVLSYIGYRSFNTEAFKNQIIRGVKDVTGRDLAVNGTAQLAWDPLPTMTLSDVTLSNIQNSTNKEMLKADRLQIQIEWASLFKSPAKIKSIILVNPRVLIERLSLSITNLDFPVLFAVADSAAPQESILGQRRRATEIDNIEIENGSVQYMNQMTGQTYTLSNMTGRIAFGSMSGPFAFEGTANVQKLPIKIKVSIGERETSKPVDFVVDASHKDSNSTLSLTGKLYPDEAQKYLTATFEFKTDRPNALWSRMGLPLWDLKENKSTVMNGLLDMNSADTTFKDVVLKIGDQETSTALSLGLVYTNATKSQQIDLMATELDLGLWRKPLLDLLTHRSLNSLPPTTIVASISKIFWNNQMASAFQMRGQHQKGGFKINELSVLLPGATTIKGSALLIPSGKKINGSAEVNLQTQSLRSVLTFFDINDLPIPADKQLFGPTRLNAVLQWQPNAWKVEIPEFNLDAISGLLHMEQSPKAPLQIQTELNNINWNLYIPQIKSEQPEMLSAFIDQTLNKFATLKLPDQPVDVEITMNNATVRQLSLTNSVVTTKTSKDSITAEGIATTNTNDEIVFQTKIDKVGTPDWIITNGMSEMKGKDLISLLSKIGIKSDSLLLQNAHTFAATANITGNLKEWQTAIKYTTQAITLEMAGKLVNDAFQQMRINLTHKNTPQFFTQLGIQPIFPKTGGTFNLSAVMNQLNDNFTLTDMELQADGQKLTGEAQFNTKTNRLTASLKASILDLTKVLPDMGHFYLSATGFDGNPFDFDFLSKMSGALNVTADEITYQTLTLRNAKLAMQLDNNTLTLTDFTATGAGDTPSTIQMRGDLNWNQKPTLNLRLATQSLPLNSPHMVFDGIGFSGGVLTSNWNLSSSGDTPLEMARTLSANGHAKLNHFHWSGADFPGAILMIRRATDRKQVSTDFGEQLRQTLTSGASPIISLEGDFNIKDGLWQMSNGTLKTTNASATGVTLDWDIPTGLSKAKIPVKLSIYPSFPPLIYDFVNGKRGVEYSLDTKPYVRALEQEFVHQKAQQEEAEVAEKKAAIEKELQSVKEQTEQAWKELNRTIDEMSKKLTATPNVLAQKELKSAQLTQGSLKTIMNQEDPLTTLQYQQTLRQIKEGLKYIKKADSILLASQIQDIELQSANLLKPVNEMILKMNEMYQKRPSLSLLADLIQNSENQRGIIERSIKQFKKNLTLQQVQGIANIIKDAHDKVNKAYDYAQELYSGRQTTGSNKIIRNAP
ncbi:MAG: AsmA family protein [Alphaproteobacteria bacterium]|nr:AsmA family protein [Alphaproteobacteria bacterium]